MDYDFETRERGSTRHKLEEATYFLGQMKRSLEDDKIFSFNLSAFITAARSVTLLMKGEFSHATGFSTWIESKQDCWCPTTLSSLIR